MRLSARVGQLAHQSGSTTATEREAPVLEHQCDTVQQAGQGLRQ